MKENNNDYSIDNVDKEAIEELLKAYKELQEWNEYYRKEMLSKEYIKLNYIPKSKVEETIAELVKKYKDILSDYGNINRNLIINIPNENVKKHCGKLVEKIIVLQELLGSYEGKYFDDTDNQIKQYFRNKSKETK